MGRQSRLHQHLKQLNANKPTATGCLTPSEDEESSSSGHEVLWSEDELDKHSEVTMKKLFHGAQPHKRPFRYTGNSKRTQKRRRADARRQAAKNGRTMLDYFSTVQASTSETHLHNFSTFGRGEDFGESGNDDWVSEEVANESEDQSSAESESDRSSEHGQLSNEKVIDILERKLDSASSSEQWRLAAVLQYLRLLKFDHSRMKASLSVARQLGQDVYLARQIRYWASLLQNGQEIPASKRGKHVKVKSLLQEEDVQHKILQYLRTSKFEFYLADFVHYVSDDVFPSLGMSQTAPIGYEAFYALLFHTCYTSAVKYCCYLYMCMYLLIDKALNSTRKTTAHRWLKRMGFTYKQYQQGICVDGHERDDVVEYRKEFLAKMKESVFTVFVK